MIVMQAVAFYLPYRVWKHLEGGKLEKILVKVTQYLKIGSGSTLNVAAPGGSGSATLVSGYLCHIKLWEEIIIRFNMMWSSKTENK